MVEREVKWGRIILAFLIATFIFSFGMLIGYMLKGVVQQQEIIASEQISDDLTSLETMNVLQAKYPCDKKISDITSDKLNYAGDLISMLEKKKGLSDSQVLEMKKSYSQIEARHMVMIRDMNENCKANYTLFLFFYSNDNSCNDEVKRVSFILTYLRNKYPAVRVYSFDVNLDSDVVSYLKDKYSARGCTSVVVNEKKFFGNLTSSSQLEGYVKK